MSSFSFSKIGIFSFKKGKIMGMFDHEQCWASVLFYPSRMRTICCNSDPDPTNGLLRILTFYALVGSEYANYCTWIRIRNKLGNLDPQHWPRKSNTWYNNINNNIKNTDLSVFFLNNDTEQFFTS